MRQTDWNENFSCLLFYQGQKDLEILDKHLKTWHWNVEDEQLLIDCKKK